MPPVSTYPIIPYDDMLKGKKMADIESEKRTRRKWVRYEQTY